MKRQFLKPKNTLRRNKGILPKKSVKRGVKSSTLKRTIQGTGRNKKRRRKGEITKLKDQLWELCKQIIRKQYGNPDGTWTCYTSKKPILLAKNVHTGHFIPSSLCSVELRYDLRNLRPQSYNENINHSGNPHTFRRNLVTDHGQAYVDELETRNEATKVLMYPKEWFESKIKEYTILIEQDGQTVVRLVAQ